jgi:hypothetical protein
MPCMHASPLNFLAMLCCTAMEVGGLRHCRVVVIEWVEECADRPVAWW